MSAPFQGTCAGLGVSFYTSMRFGGEEGGSGLNKTLSCCLTVQILLFFPLSRLYRAAVRGKKGIYTVKDDASISLWFSREKSRSSLRRKMRVAELWMKRRHKTRQLVRVHTARSRPPHGREKQSREVPILGCASHIPNTERDAAAVPAVGRGGWSRDRSIV